VADTPLDALKAHFEKPFKPTEIGEYLAEAKVLVDAAVAYAEKMLGQDRQFPIMGAPTSVPWAMIAPYDYYAKRNHHQDLETLARRGGLDPIEALAVLTSQSWSDVKTVRTQTAERRLMEMVEEYKRGH
jgi:hypothetical protein